MCVQYAAIETGFIELQIGQKLTVAIWKAQSIQFVWIEAGANAAPADAVYKAFAGQPHTSLQQEQLPPPMTGVVTRAAGAAHGIEIRVETQPSRTDLHLLPTQAHPAPGTLPDVPGIADVAATLEVLQPKIAAVCELVHSCIRPSLIINLFRQTNSPEDATLLQAKNVGLDLEMDDAEDFLFNINRKMTAKFDSSIKFNRVMKWSVAAFQFFGFNFGVSLQTPFVAQAAAAQLMLDFNVHPTGRIFTRDEQVTIFAELVAEALRCAEINSPAALR